MKKGIALFFFFSWLQDQAQSLVATADQNRILIGGQFHLQLQGRFAQGKEAWLVVDTIPHFEVLDRSRIDTQTNYLGVTLTQTLTLTSWDSGAWALPSFEAAGARSTPVKVSVAFSSPFDPAQPYHDVKDIIPVQKPPAFKWYWYLAFLLILVVLFLLFFPKEKKKEKAGFVTDEGAYRQALKKLDQLQQRKETDARKFHTEMIHIFREYLHKRRNLQSFSKTTDDLAVQIAALNLPPASYQSLVQALRLSDLVKFARFNPAAEENAAALETVRESIVHLEQIPNAV